MFNSHNAGFSCVLTGNRPRFYGAVVIEKFWNWEIGKF